MSEKQQFDGRTTTGQKSQLVLILVLVFALVIGAGLWLLKRRSSQLTACRRHNWAAAAYDDPLLDQCAGKGVPDCDHRQAYVHRLQETSWLTIQPGNPLLADCAGLKACEDRRDYRPVNKCQQQDWTRVNYKDPLLVTCAGTGFPEYEKRRVFIDGVKKKDWGSVPAGDIALNDCAGWEPCTMRVDQLKAPPPVPKNDTAPPATDKKVPKNPPTRAIDWPTASCDVIMRHWEPEDQRLSTCESLSPAACSHIKRCVGVNDPNLGPGVKQ